MKKLTTNEFFESSEATKLLKENLENNIEVFCEKMSENSKSTLMRLNLIVIRQCLEDCGYEPK